VASQSPALCDGLCTFLSIHNTNVIRTADDLTQLPLLAAHTQPDVVLIDVTLANETPSASLESTINKLKSQDHPAAIILLAVQNGYFQPPGVLRVDGHAAMGEPPGKLLETMHRVTGWSDSALRHTQP